MSLSANAFPRRSSIPGTVIVGGVWTGGGAAANCSVASGDWNRGIESVNYNAATGKYKITFREGYCGQQIVKWNISVGRDAASVPLFAILQRGTYSASARTVDFEVRTEAALTDLATTDKVCIEVVFASNAP